MPICDLLSPPIVPLCTIITYESKVGGIIPYRTFITQTKSINITDLKQNEN